MQFSKKYVLAVSVPILVLMGYWGLATKKNITLLSLVSLEKNENAINSSSTEKKLNEFVRNPVFINTPDVVKGIYLTSWSGGSKKKIDEVIKLSKTFGINSVVIDIKDFSGYLAYDTGLEQVKKYKAHEIKIANITDVINKLHSENIYTIARITVFQDPVMAKTRPDLAVRRKSTGGIWLDRKGLGWIDPSNKDYWNYIVDISKDARSRGFDELNFDYIRFPSDGNLADMEFPSWNRKIPKHEIIREFFKHLRDNLPGVKISADLFGLATIQKDDLGIGQIIEDAYENFDYVSPMVYPSHYASGFLGYKSPAKYPYEVIKYSMDSAVKKLSLLDGSAGATSTASASSTNLIASNKKFAELRPWIQDFDLGADYNVQMVKLEIDAIKDALGSGFTGFMLWSPSNIYTVEALR
ncbi:MAG: putative glycoside hydrolase [Candidatus Wolfebacteria bacterium]|nr:putative glycoside hydrolase [Candidatus Wolfebacteria bacterium]